MERHPSLGKDDTLARLLDAALSPVGAWVELALVAEAGECTVASLTGDRAFVLGRGTDCDVRFDSGDHPRVSLRHAELAIAGAEVRLRDLDSRNGTLVNDVPVDGAARLADGDRITLGRGGPQLRVAIYEPPGPGDEA